MKVRAAVQAIGITKGSPEWERLLPPDGSAVYQPSDADLEYLIPLVETARDNGRSVMEEADRNMPGWVFQQVKLAVQSGTPFRDCLRVSAFSRYLAGFLASQCEPDGLEVDTRLT